MLECNTVVRKMSEDDMKGKSSHERNTTTETLEWKIFLIRL